jgi:hypothetical protein
MDNYYVNNNAQSNGDYEVHKEDCSFMPGVNNRTDLGSFSNCREAVEKAKEFFTQVNGCYYCSRECHTS